MDLAELCQVVCQAWLALIVGFRQQLNLQYRAWCVWFMMEELHAQAKRRKRNAVRFLHISHLLIAAAVSYAASENSALKNVLVVSQVNTLVPGDCQG